MFPVPRWCIGCFAADDPPTGDPLRHLQAAVIGAVNNLLSCGAVRPDHVYEMTVAGNSVKRDLFLGRPVGGLGAFPFEPVSTGAVNLGASGLGIAIHPRGNVYALPLVRHFVGADTLALILATGMHRAKSTATWNNLEGSRTQRVRF